MVDGKGRWRVNIEVRFDKHIQACDNLFCEGYACIFRFSIAGERSCDLVEFPMGGEFEEVDGDESLYRDSIFRRCLHSQSCGQIKGGKAARSIEKGCVDPSKVEATKNRYWNHSLPAWHVV